MIEYKAGKRNIRYRVDVYRGAAKKGELMASDAKISMSSSSEIKVSTSFTVASNKDIDWYKDRLRPVLVDGGKETPLGIFVPGSVSKESGLLQVDAYDLGILLQEDKIDSRIILKAGSNYIEEIEKILISAGITKIIAEPSEATLLTDRADWDIGTEKLKIVNQLLEEISYNDVSFDQAGSCLLRAHTYPSAATIKHIYKSGEASIISSEISVVSNAHEIPNVFIAVVSNPDNDEPLISKYTNDNPVSKTSTVYTGRRKVSVLKPNNVATQADLDNYVRKAAFEAMQEEETVKFVTAINPEHGIGDTVALDLPKYSGILEETDWEIDLSSLEMTHTGKKVIYL